MPHPMKKMMDKMPPKKMAPKRMSRKAPAKMQLDRMTKHGPFPGGRPTKFAPKRTVQTT